MMNKILIFDENKQSRDALKTALSEQYNLILTDDIQQAEYCLQNAKNISLFCVQAKQNSLLPFEKISAIKEVYPQLKILCICAYQDSPRDNTPPYINALLIKPFDHGQLIGEVNKLLQ